MTEADQEVTEAPAIPSVEDQRAAIKARVRLCGEAIQKVLADHDCTIQAYLLPIEQVGNTGAKAQIGCAWGVFPTALR